MVHGMKLLLAFFISYFIFSFSTMAIDIDIPIKEWKQLDLPNKFPQTYVISNDFLPLYFETGENTSELSEFFISFNKGKFVPDVDEDDALRINELKIKFFNIIGSNKLQLNKGYLVNVSVNKMFACGPCTEQKEYVEILKLDELNVINIHLI